MNGTKLRVQKETYKKYSQLIFNVSAKAIIWIKDITKIFAL